VFAQDISDAQPVTIGALGQTGGGGAFHARFADGQQIMRPRSPTGRSDTVPKTDPLEQARADGFAQGFDEGMRVAIESFSADEEAKIRLAQSLEQVAPATNGILSSLLSAAVLRLVSQIVGETPVDAALLAKRVEGVAAFIQDVQSRNSLHVNPEDMALLAGYEFGFPLTPDPDVGRGGVRLDTADGWIEDGPDVQLSRLKAMLDDMEGKG
tara:strand:+ start:5756 stop:6388 length:633 start_codon:yes stop_codon:yes gene_type:complete